jgi:chromosomal replication initiator protein
MDLQTIWQAALGELELALSKVNFTTWFKNTHVIALEGQRIIIAVPNAFTKSWFERKYHDAILRAVRGASGQNIREIDFRVEVKNTSVLPLEIPTGNTPASSDLLLGTSPDQVEYAPAQNQAPSSAAGDIGLNPRYVFGTFIVGKNNELAHAAAMAASTQPGVAYNPLFVYGGVGMGKTHLLQAVGHHILQTNPTIRVRYVTSERFTNEYIQAVHSGRASEFKDHYRNVDVLLVDDIQFISGKEGTQEEFFHTFNALHQNNKQIVLAADRAPKDIAGIESRLLSRFEWGMTADISKPDFEMRVAILQAKAEEKRYPLSIEILHSIAGTIQSNIRELEGALNKIVAYHQFKNIPASLQTVETVLQSFAPATPKRTLTPRQVIEVVHGHFEITLDQITGQSRERRFAIPRQIAMYLLREEMKCSFPSIGSEIGGRDHTTAMHACQKIQELLAQDEQLKQDLALIREKLYSQTAHT